MCQLMQCADCAGQCRDEAICRMCQSVQSRGNVQNVPVRAKQSQCAECASRCETMAVCRTGKSVESCGSLQNAQVSAKLRQCAKFVGRCKADVLLECASQCQLKQYAEYGSRCNTEAVCRICQLHIYHISCLSIL